MGSIGQQPDSGGNVRFSTAKQVVGAAVVLGGVALLVASIALPIFRHAAISMTLGARMMGGMILGGMALSVGLHTALQARVNRAAQQQMAPQAQPRSMTQEQLAQSALDQVNQPNAKKEHDERQACLNGRFDANSFNKHTGTCNNQIHQQDTAEKAHPKQSHYNVKELPDGWDDNELKTINLPIQVQDKKTSNQYENKTLEVTKTNKKFDAPTPSINSITTSSAATAGIIKNKLFINSDAKHMAMEDAHGIHEVRLGNHSGLLSLVCDGHNDEGTIARYANENFPRVLNDSFQYFKEKNAWDDKYIPQPHEMANILSRSCILLHAQICSEQGPKSSYNMTAADSGGACLVGSLILNDQLYTFNLGDSRAVLSYNKGNSENPICRSLTYDHKPSDPTLKEDIESRGGTINDEKKLGKSGLGICRALGDTDTPGVSCIPDINHVNLAQIKENGATSVQLVLACDGIFDVLSSQDVGEIAFYQRDDGTPTTAILGNALEKGAHDNLSVIHMNIEL